MRRRIVVVGLSVIAVATYGAAVIFGAITHPTSPPTGTTVTGKHHVAAHEECTDRDGCVWTSATWQLDTLSGRIALTIDVSEQTYDHYQIGDFYDGEVIGRMMSK